MAKPLAELEREQAELSALLADPGTASNPRELARIATRQSEVDKLLVLHREVARLTAEVASLEGLAKNEADPELKSMAEEELVEKKAQLAARSDELAELERPRDPRDTKNAILEIRAGAGGDEASLFAAELYAMYTRFAERQKWQVELYSSSPSEAGGYKEIIFEVGGEDAYGTLKFEAGTHRVQRVPATESQGRIHTSTATVAVLPEAEEADVEISPEEIRIDVFRSSGPGGQSVNTTDSAVRITHLPTGLVVSCQDEKSQHKNRAKAMSILRARLQAQREEEAAKERGEARRAQVGSGDRSEKIRTYNFPQDRLTDHRISFTTHGLDKIMAGNLEPVLEALQKAARADA